MHDTYGYIYFNSIKVRLERNKAIDIDYNYKFQFHKGAIRTISSQG